MLNLDTTIGLLDRINAAVSKYDPSIKEKARDLLFAAAFPGRPAPQLNAHITHDSDGAKVGADAPDRLVALLDRCTPEKPSEWALLCAYAIADGEMGRPVSGLSVNKLMTNHGHGQKNITRVVQANIDAKPQLMRQVRKTGKSRQARKQYTLTQPGVEWVQHREQGRKG